MLIRIGNSRFCKTGLSTKRIDLYHRLVSLTWPRFHVAFLATEAAINSLFAGLYLLDPGGIGNQSPKGFFGAFFFSMETPEAVSTALRPSFRGGEAEPGTGAL